MMYRNRHYSKANIAAQFGQAPVNRSSKTICGKDLIDAPLR